MRGLIRLRSISFLSKLIKYICTDNLTFLSDRYNADGSELLDKTTLGNDVPIKANALSLNGTSSKIVVTDDNIELIVTLSITFSVDFGTTFNTWLTGDAIIAGLLDITGNVLTVGFSGSTYLECIVSEIIGLDSLGEELLHLRFAENINSSSYNISNNNLLNVQLIDTIPYASANRQALFSGDATGISGNEVVDNSQESINADIYGFALFRAGGLPRIALENHIEIDYRVSGFKWEYVYSLESGATVSHIYTYATSLGTCAFRTAGFLFRVETSTGSQIAGIPVKAYADDKLRRVKCEVNGTTITVTQSDWDDYDYLTSAVETASIDITSITDYANIVSSTISLIGNGINGWRGILKYVNIMGYEFCIEDNNVNRYDGIWPDIHSVSNINRAARISALDTDWIKSPEKISYCANGYTAIYMDEAKKIFNLPYVNGVSQISEFKAAHPSENIGYKEFAKGVQGNGYSIALNSSLLSYDIDNTFFDISNVPIKHLSSTIPDRLKNRIFYDKNNFKNLLLYDQPVELTNNVNYVGESFLSIGDSVAGNNWTYVLTNMLGMSRELAHYGGMDCEEILALLTTQVSGDSTLISRQKVIILTCGFNDYGKGNSLSTTTTDYRLLLDYINDNRADDSILVLTATYNWSLVIDSVIQPIDDGNTPNGNGMSMNQLHDMIIDTALLYNLPCTNLQEIPIIQEDLKDNVHPATGTGNLKIALANARILYAETETLIKSENTDCSSIKASVPFYNLIHGCDVYEDNAHVGDEAYYRFVPLKEDGEPVVTEIIGYTKLYGWRFTDKIIPNLDGVYDLTTLGYGELSFDEIVSHVDAGSKIWYEVVNDNGIKNLSIYSIETEGACFNKNVKAYKLLPYCEIDEDGTYHINEDGTYELNNDWKI